jgi:hypothetical protein
VQVICAFDRLWADRDLINEDSREQRFEATQRIATELDKRNVPMRNPAIEQAAIRVIRRRIGVAEDGSAYL